MGVSGAEVARTYAYDEDDVVRIPERKSALVTNCPPSIQEKLERAEFKQGEEDNTYIKYQESLAGQERQIARVTLYGDAAHVSVYDSVGILTFTPDVRISVEPKLTWEAVVDMLLTVYQWNRGPEYHGIPLDDFMSGDIDFDDIFLIFAINYLEALRPIRRNGFVRKLPTRREQLEEPRGNIDIAESLASPDPLKHSCIYTETTYDTSVNSLLHYAGVRLLRAYQQAVIEGSPENEEQYNRVFAEVHTTVQRMEELGITSGQERVHQYQQVSTEQLPPGRHYYNRAIDISQTILSSSLGYKVGQKELIVDYVLNMDSLFEEYTQVVLEQELESIKEADHLSLLDDIVVKHEPVQHPYAETDEYTRKPDHVLTRERQKSYTGFRSEWIVRPGKSSVNEMREYQGTDEHGRPLAVMDSKYYDEDTDPIGKSPARAQMLTYGYLMAAGRLAFLTPYGASQEYTLETGAVLKTVAPRREFTTDDYREALRNYLISVLVDEFGSIVRVFTDVAENDLALDSVEMGGLSGLDAPDSQNPFDYTQNPQRFAYDTLESVKRTLDITDSDMEDNWLSPRLRREYQNADVENDMKRLRAIPIVSEQQLAPGVGKFGTLKIYFLEQQGNQSFKLLHRGSGENPVEIPIR
jgi:5-methylcytosine-specific restriction endonuclease McrBC regulatory subunit McrC